MASSPTTARTLLTGAFVSIGVLDPAETMDPSMGAQGLAVANDLIGQWAIQRLTIPSIQRVTQALTANTGSTGTPYTVGTGGTINIDRPVDIAACATYLTSTTPAVEIPRALFTPEQWAAIPVKNLPGVLFTGAFYNPTTATNRGELYLWPVPDNALYTLVLYLSNNLDEFTTLDASYYVAPGYVQALKYQLGLVLSDLYPDVAIVTPRYERTAAIAFANIKRQNTTITDMANDFAAIGTNAPAYDIMVG